MSKADRAKWNAQKMMDGYCPSSEDETHCEHWWDGGPNGSERGGKPCCSCGFLYVKRKRSRRTDSSATRVQR